MIRRASLLLFVLGSAAVAQEAGVKIAFKKPAVGEKYQENRKEVQTQTITFMAMGQTQTRTSEVTTELAYVEEVLAVMEGARKPTKCKRHYRKAVQKVDGKERELVAAGTTILITNQKGKLSYVVDEQDLPAGPMLELLKREFETKNKATDDDFLPTKPVKSGDNWSIDREKLGQDLLQAGLVVDVKTAKASGQLNSFDPQTGRGSMVAELDFPLLKMKTPNGETTLKEGRLQISMKFNGNLDGKAVSGQSTINSVSNITLEQPGGLVQIENKSERTHSIEPLSKSPEK